MTMKNLIDWIRRYQKDKGLTDTEFAKRIDYRCCSSWTRIKSGKRLPTLRFFRGVIREFPELKPLVDEWMYPARPQGIFERPQDGRLARFRAWLRDCLRRVRNEN